MQNEEGRFGAATDEQIALAREICARIVEGDSDNPLRVQEANRYLAGKRDDFHDMHIALRAIQMTTELAAKMAEWAHMVPPDGGSPTAEESDLAASIASALRKNDHLKGQP